jgi:tRNA 2-(methylsulfanyl)-N6-isopentenyladenosine37 hydroxylase
MTPISIVEPPPFAMKAVPPNRRRRFVSVTRLLAARVSGVRNNSAVELLTRTPPAWVRLATLRFDEVLVDHAHCEKKAAAQALSMLSAFPDVPRLGRAMARLAREEAGHLAQVLQLLDRRGLRLGRDPGDPYAQELQRHVRHPRTERLLDRLLVSALIELRSQERLGLLAVHLREPELCDFYARLAAAEAGHGELFWKLALETAPEEAARRGAQLASAEARILEELPLRAAIH